MYFAKLNESNIVETIIVADSKEWCEQNLGGMWVRAHEPLEVASGYTYDKDQDKFIAPVVESVEELVEEPIEE
jgi:hypothetical protein